jgi:ArsR family transcriptional regulator
MKLSKINQPKIRDLARIFKALSDENRLAVFQLLRERCGSGCSLSEEQAGSCVSEIAEHFDLALSTISHHLKELRNAGLIVCEKRGQWVHCRPNDAVLKQVERFLQE